ncbi:actin-interacting protein 1 [Caerostris extrusa]|uniref:Actin-interacting protein 1 n=1 Tax=Caerostris extrusa TaxID=172846 RepID=A0AAV4UDW5_CAEEX|nr:actin-interacting protein 1 [Caerostris extrusa]
MSVETSKFTYFSRSTFITLPRTQRGVPLVLGGDPKGKTILYPHANHIIIRDIDNPLGCDIYTEHRTQTTCAKYSPNGFYIASADQYGKVRIWDATQPEHILKNEFQPIVGVITDLSWSPDSKRICAVGESRGKFAHVFNVDTGTSLGEIGGHSKKINSCDFSPNRPFRIVTGCEDKTVGVFVGPPFKFESYLDDHINFVQCVRFAGNGDFFASGGFDGKMFLYKTEDSSLVGEFGNATREEHIAAHKGGVYGVSWSPDGTKLLSASGDKTCKLWDVSTMTAISEFVMGKDIIDQQVSCLWQGEHLLSVSLAGFISYLDINNPSKPIQVLKGHNKSITSLMYLREKKELYTASHDGAVMYWNTDKGVCNNIKGRGHSNQIQGMAYNNAETIHTVSLDDTLKHINTETHKYVEFGTMKCDSPPKGIHSVKSGLTIVGCLTEIIVIYDTEAYKFPLDFESSCISVHSTSDDPLCDCEIALGGNDKKVHTFRYDQQLLEPRLTEEDIEDLLRQGKEPEDKYPIEFRKVSSEAESGYITAIKYSPNGFYIATANTNRKVMLYISETLELAHKHEWGFHRATVNCLAWNPNNLFVASGSLDTNIIIWDVQNPKVHVFIRNAHLQSQITQLEYLDELVLVSAGQDGNIKTWEIYVRP